MLDEFIKELERLKHIETEYQFALKDKEKLAHELFKFKMKEWENKTASERKEEYKTNDCKCCRHYPECFYMNNLPDDILQPNEIKGWFPSQKTCGKFEWN